jgi:hypothetical protein
MISWIATPSHLAMTEQVSGSQVSVCLLPRFIVGSFRLRFRFLRLFHAGKEGLAPFHDRRRLGGVCPELSAAEPMSAKREPGTQEAKAPERRGKDRPIDPTSGKNSPA